jgi:signal transduction histidine kinase
MKKSVGIVSVFLFMLIFGSRSEAVSIDSLRIVVRNLPDDTTKAKELANLSYKYIKYQIDSSLYFASEALKLSKKLNYNYGYAYALKQKGLAHKYLAEYDSAMYCYTKSLEYFDNLGIDSERASLLNRLGNLYKRDGLFDQSLESFLSALSISELLKDSTMISAIYNNLGILYLNIGNHNKALEYHMLNLNLKRKLKSEESIPIILMNIGNVYREKGSYEQAIEFYNQALVHLEYSDYKYDRLLLVHNMGTLYEENNKFKEALEFYNKALSLEKEMNDKEMQVFSLQGIGNVLIKSGNFNEGIKYLENSYALANLIGDIRKQHALSSDLYKEYEKQGDFKKGFVFLKRYVQIEDSIFNLEGKKQITELEQKYEAEKRNQQIAFLEKEQSIQKLELSKREIEAKQKSFQRNVLIIAIIVVLVLTFYFARENKKRKRINNLLIKQNKKITEQRTEIVNQNNELIESNKTKDRLFQIIAHDLRSPLVSMDSITQLIPYWVEEQDYESLKKLSKTLELSVKNVLSLIDNLLNWALNQQGNFPYKPENLRLKENILETIEVYRPIAEIKNIDLKFIFTKDVLVFADRNMLFTVMRNLLNNAVKFTPEKGEIIVGIDCNQQFAKVWVKDSGIGIPKEKREMVFELANGQGKGTKGETGKGLGLFFCKEFVSMNNGDIFIESGMQKGTTITFTLPLFNVVEN